jgi:short-subunit dehydrogenase involved in D-alanine esterification of teichoic acids
VTGLAGRGIRPTSNAKAQTFEVAHSSAKDCDYKNELRELIERIQNEHPQVAARIAAGSPVP